MQRGRQLRAGREDLPGQGVEGRGAGLRGGAEQPVREGDVHDVVARGKPAPERIVELQEVIAAGSRDSGRMPDDAVFGGADDEMKHAGHRRTSPR